MRGWKNFFLVFKVFMALIYLGLGGIILFSRILPLPISDTGMIFIGIILILYGLFRIYSYSRVIKAQDDED
jgi:hypothetical protein